ncbi:Predicted glycosyl hydrolase, GH43/DUF377 family [Flavobacterium micromati]|uniref:Predicted glycosyl hydrolase, GH43/DUF377 family n=1 Tax=Flavobacterium micromati TaxID=229205 RepID=A0A1M5MT31_9FLAO|nr:pesticidal protein Cry7Aa [Flavobacterium micromati]MCL6461496.1 pesticidal protein Cry7Aa [Flavobacterium micromati]SHG80367.1 Predicted glycosyl hydrolase, GH43/DUF377 family [Flavobacterium micromati]
MINIKKEGIILEKTALLFENESVLNPAIMQEGNVIHMLYRAVRAGNYSTVGYCKLEGATEVVQRNNKPLLIPCCEEASNGIEDPRIVKIDGIYYITYTSFDGINALGTLVTSSDLVTFTNHGIIVPQFTFDEFQRLAECTNLVNAKYFRHVRHFNRSKKVFIWDKDVIFFPRRINGKLAFLHRIRPGIQLVLITSLEDLTREFWNNYFLHFNEHIILDPVGSHHESSFTGGGCPPIETEDGWILIYHGVFDTSEGYIYSAAAALLDLENPTKVVGRLPYPLISPEIDYEINGIVDNVVFPTGTALFDDKLYIYYGAADNCIACASLSFSELLNELKLNPVVEENN